MKCKHCKEKFTPRFSSLEKYCLKTDECIKAFSDSVKAKKWKSDKAVMKNSLMTHKDYLKLLQVVFNTFVRTRDKDLPCVSCGCNMTNRKGDASHYFSIGSSPNLRFNEDNVHLSCVPCNQFSHGNLIEYGLRLPFRIGTVKFNKLTEDRNVIAKYSIDEIQQMIIEYKAKIKAMIKN